MKILAILSVVLLLVSCDQEEKKEEDPKVEGTPADELPQGVGTLAIGHGISTLPKVTDPVYKATDANEETDTFDSQSGTLAVDFDLLADTGISLGDETTESKFRGKNGYSKAACVMVNRARGFLHQAATMDFYECEFAINLGSVDVYDEKFHVFSVKESEDGEVIEEKFRFKFEGTKEKLTGFTLQVCENGEQSYYAKKTLNQDGTYQIIGKKINNSIENPQVKSFANEITVSGKIDDKGRYTDLKKIDQYYFNVFSNDSKNYFKEQVIQSSKNIQYIGVNYQDEEYDKYLAFLELIDHNETGETLLKKLALGDGAMLYSHRGDDFITEGWDADSWLTNSQATQIAKVDNRQNELPTSVETKSIAYQGEEIWDCSDEPEFILGTEILEELDEKYGDEYDKCDGYMLNQDNYIQCFDR